MLSIMAGRGRGRGRGAFNFDALAKTVGSKSPEKNGPFSELTLMVNALDINATSFHAVMQCAANALTDDSSEKGMERVMKLLSDRCTKDWHFAPLAAIICQHLVSRDNIGKKFRAHLLRTMQTNFKDKNEIRNESVAKFIGSMSFLCQTLAVLRADSGAPFVPLIAPVVEVIALMLKDNASDIEMECGVHQMVSVMPTVYTCESSKMEEYHRLIATLRLHILDARGSRTLREKMLDAIEENASQSSLSKQH